MVKLIEAPELFGAPQTPVSIPTVFVPRSTA